MINTVNKIKPSPAQGKDDEDDFEREIQQIDEATRDNVAANMSMHRRQSRSKKHEETAGEKFYRSLQPNQ